MPLLSFALRIGLHSFQSEQRFFLVLCLIAFVLMMIWHVRLRSSDELLHFVWVVDDAKCIVITRVCVCVCLSVCLSVRGRMLTLYCTDPEVTWGSGRGWPLVVHYWADLQLVHGLRCYGNITRTRNVSEYMLVLAARTSMYSLTLNLVSLFLWLFCVSYWLQLISLHCRIFLFNFNWLSYWFHFHIQR